jgi:hypothetical protein
MHFRQRATAPLKPRIEGLLPAGGPSGTTAGALAVFERAGKTGELPAKCPGKELLRHR